MSNYIKFEMMNLLNKKNMSILFLFTLIIFCSCILMQKKNEEAYRNQLDDIKIMEQNEQYHINILKYDLEENNNVKNKPELFMTTYKKKISLVGGSNWLIFFILFFIGLK